MNEPVGGTDFLGRLVDRACGDDGGLQPRLPSLFEPSRFTGVGSIIDEPESPLDEAVGGHSQPTCGGDDIRHKDTDRALTPHDRIAPHFRLQPPPDHTTAEAVAAVSHATRFAQLHARTAITAFEPSRDRDAVVPASDISRGASLDAGDDIHPARTETRAAAVRDGTARDHTPSQNGTLTPSFDRIAHAVVVAPQTAYRRPPPQQLPAQNLIGSEQSVINVTIGRVEVRATPSTPTRNHAKAHGPQPMSLDDYLQRRGGRG